MAYVSELMAGKAGEHLVCFDLLSQGVEAFLSAQGLPFDVVAIVNGKVYRIQVKSAIKSRNDKYIYNIKYGKSGNYKPYSNNEVDVVAFVSLETKEIAYLPIKDCKSIIEFMVTANKGTYLSENMAENLRLAVAYAHENPTETARSICMRFGDVSVHTLRRHRRKVGEYKHRFELRYFPDFPFSKAIQ